MGLMLALWLLSLALRDASIVDIFWGLGFVIQGWFYFFNSPHGFLPRKLLLITLVTLWGLRLALHLAWRNLPKGEDFRYARWRARHGGDWWWRSFFQVFLLQGVLIWLIAVPLWVAQAASAPARLTWLDGLAACLWAFGFFFEAVGDGQLMRFKADPANTGKLLTGGVWAYSRHPNYFGDGAQWLAYGLFAIAAGGWWTFYAPLLMNVLLVRVSGVTLLEKSMKRDKPGYADYAARTSAYIPWFPRRGV